MYTPVRFLKLRFSFLCIAALGMACKQEDQPISVSTVFMQISPAHAAKGVDTSPSFSWEMAENAVTYTLSVASDSAFIDLVINQEGIVDNQYLSLVILEHNTRYYWKVSAINEGGVRIATNAGLYFRTLALPAAPSPHISKYYVSPDGEDNPGKGTFSNPFKTLAYAATMVPPSEGDTILLTPGIFIETEPAIIPLGVSVFGSGESNTVITTSSTNLSVAGNVITALYRNSYEGSLIQLVSPHSSGTVIAPAPGNQILSGFTIDGNNKTLKAGVWVENRNNVTMHQVTIKNMALRGAVFAPGDKEWYKEPAYYMTNINISECTFLNSGKDLSEESLGNLCIAQLDGAEIRDISIIDNEGYGIKFIYDGYFKNVKIHDCNITLNETDAKWGEDIAIEMWNLGTGNEIYNINCNTWISVVNHPEIFANPTSEANMKLYNIKIVDKDGNSGKEAIEIGTPGVEIYDSYFENKGIGIAIWDMGRNKITIRNNIFSNSLLHNNWASGSAIFIANSRTWNFSDINIFNNVFDTFITGIFLKQESDKSKIDNVQIINNAFLGINDTNIKIAGSVNNIWVQNNLKNAASVPTWIKGTSASITESANLTGDPGFLLSGIRWNTWYKASSEGSLTVDQGKDVGIHYNGSAPDIGRWEF